MDAAEVQAVFHVGFAVCRQGGGMNQTSTRINAMTIRTQTRSVSTYRPHRKPAVSLLGWLVEANRRYRESVKLRNMPDERLYDMGISREEADAAFLRRFGGRR